jgi:subtilisin family serine protease
LTLSFQNAVVAIFLLYPGLSAQTRPQLPDVSAYAFPAPAQNVGAPSVSSQRAIYTSGGSVPLTGVVEVGIKLQDPPLVVAVGANAKQNGSSMSAAQQRAYLAQLNQKQNALMAQIGLLGGTEIGRVSISHNALYVSIDARQLTNLKNLAGVVAVRPLNNYQISLADTLSYIGATAVQNNGITGQGIRIAMLDTGIDYTHYNLGGSGNVADYNIAKADASSTPPPNLFPTSKVVGGYDFTGEVWPNGPLQPDPNPIDLNGHGTLTADTAGGRSNDGLHVGTAPGAQLYAVKVCSSVSSACSGLAMSEGLDFALDPNHTGTISDAVDVISMSIGGSFGMREDDVSESFTDIVNFGVVSVVSAGNDGDIPYIIAHPASTPEVLALAATQGVSATAIPLVINSPANIAGTYTNTATLSFAPVNTTVTGNVVYIGRGCPAGSINPGSPADPYLANPSGAIALIDRGACAVSLKIDAAARAGAIGVLIGLVAPGDAITFSNGGGTQFVPSLVIIQSYSNTIKTAISGGSTVNATISPNDAISLAGDIASYSSRGPNYSYNMLKPDMSAPGTVTGAAVGSGTGQITESGTSFACPLTAGSAALLLSQNHTLTPLDIKALLMENSNATVHQNSSTQPGVLAPLSRAGAGELRINQAVASSTAAWDASDPLAVSLSFGTYRLNVNQTFKKKVILRNYSNTARIYSATNTYRDAPNTTGVTLSFPSSVFVPANSSASFVLSLTVNAASLPAWTLNGGSNGGNGELLNTVEYAGQLTFVSGSDSVHLPWHILPHHAANVLPAVSAIALGGTPQMLPLSNTPSSLPGTVNLFSLTGTGTQFPASVLPAPGSDYAVINLQAVGVRLVCISACSTSPAYGVQFAINTFGQRSHPDVPAEFDVFIDVTGSGTPDFDVFNADIGLETTRTASSGQNGVFVVDEAAGTVSGPYFYTVADLDSANVILTVPLSALSSATSGRQVTTNAPFIFDVAAFDNYFTGNLTDLIAGMQYELDSPTVFPVPASLVVPSGSTANVTVFPSSPYNGNSPSQTGLLLMYTDGKTGQESSNVLVTP